MNDHVLETRFFFFRFRVSKFIYENFNSILHFNWNCFSSYASNASMSNCFFFSSKLCFQYSIQLFAIRRIFFNRWNVSMSSCLWMTCFHNFDKLSKCLIFLQNTQNKFDFFCFFLFVEILIIKSIECTLTIKKRFETMFSKIEYECFRDLKNNFFWKTFDSMFKFFVRHNTLNWML